MQTDGARKRPLETELVGITDAFYDEARWVRRLLWAPYVGFVAYLFFGHVGQAFGAAAAVELADLWVARMLVWAPLTRQPGRATGALDTTLLMRRAEYVNPPVAAATREIRGYLLAPEALFRLATVLAGVWLAVFTAWVSGTATIMGQERWAVWTALMVALLATRWIDTWQGALWAVFVQLGLWLVLDLSGGLFNAEPWLRGALALFAFTLFVAGAIYSGVAARWPPADRRTLPRRLVPAIWIWVALLPWALALLAWGLADPPDASELDRLIPV